MIIPRQKFDGDLADFPSPSFDDQIERRGSKRRRRWRKQQNIRSRNKVHPSETEKKRYVIRREGFTTGKPKFRKPLYQTYVVFGGRSIRTNMEEAIGGQAPARQGGIRG